MKPWVFLLAVTALAQKLEFVEVPAGSFTMGCKPEFPCAEGLPQREVRFDTPFLLARTEVTVAQFRAFVKQTGYRTDAEKAGEARTWRAPGFRVASRQPVVCMTQNDAAAYCEWAGARLPSEAEWEYAARAGSQTHHFWGEEIDGRYLWYRANSGGQPHPVARKLPNPWGLYDMEGNAWEWVAAKPPHTGVTLPGHGTIRGGGFMTCPEPYPPKDGRRQRQIGVSVVFEGFKTQNFKANWRRDDSGFRCARDRR